MSAGVAPQVLSPPQEADEVWLRGPTRADAVAIWRLVTESGGLEPNTCYAYMLLSTHFAPTCVVAERDGEVVGFIAAYRPPIRPESVFVWQVGVAAEARGQGLASRMLGALLERPGCEGVRYLEATVAESNQASDRLFRGFARDRGVGCELHEGFDAADFAPLTHETEPLYRIGPFTSDP